MTGEAELLASLRGLLGDAPAGETWIGDDMAVVARPRAPWLLLSADTVVAGVHADLTLTSVEDLGWKAMACNLSDVAAMGGRPGHALVTVAGPPGTDLEALYAGIMAAARAYDCPVVGGDLSQAPVLVVTVAVTATCDGVPVRRDGAGVGDGIWVTGALGASAAGLRHWRAGAARGAPGPTQRVGPDGTRLEDESDIDAFLRAADARPRPRLAEGEAARLAGATAIIDVSDGFAADIGHIADASRVGFELDDVPVAPGATLEEALAGGEDYQLIFCAPDPGSVATCFAGLGSPHRVGTCVADPARRLLRGDPLPPKGWQHHL